MAKKPYPPGKGVSPELLVQLAELRLKNPRRTGVWYAEQLGVSPRAITKAMDQVEREWREAYLGERQKQAAEEAARLDWIVGQAVKGWEKSLVTKQVTTRERIQKNGTVAKDKIRYTTEEPAGDPRFLNVLLDVAKLRFQALGLEAPRRIDLSILASGFEAIKLQLVQLVSRHLAPEQLNALLVEAETLYSNEAKRIEATTLKGELE